MAEVWAVRAVDQDYRKKALENLFGSGTSGFIIQIFRQSLYQWISTLSTIRITCCLVIQSCQNLWDLTDCSLPGSSVLSSTLAWDFPGKHTGGGLHFLLQGIFLAQGSNLCVLHLLPYWADSLPLVPSVKPTRITWGAFIIHHHRWITSEPLKERPRYQQLLPRCFHCTTKVKEHC